jgi:TRAP-type C4-dicarboxylate transport system permease small subunit
VLALIVLGPLALFLVWKSPKMGRTWKILMAVLILAYTGYCGYFAYQLMSIELRQLHELGDVMRQLESR